MLPTILDENIIKKRVRIESSIKVKRSFCIAFSQAIMYLKIERLMQSAQTYGLEELEEMNSFWLIIANLIVICNIWYIWLLIEYIKLILHVVRGSKTLVSPQLLHHVINFFSIKLNHQDSKNTVSILQPGRLGI